MTISHSQVTVAITATALNTVSTSRPARRVRKVKIQNQSAAAVFIGGSTVSTSVYTYKLAATSGEVEFTLGLTDVLYATVASATSVVGVTFYDAV